MSHNKKHGQQPWIPLGKALAAPSTRKLPPHKVLVESLLDSMKEGAEFESLTDLIPKNLNLRDELRRGMEEVEAARGRPLVVYVGNVIKPDSLGGIDIADDLPFSELIASVPSGVDSVDILIVTPGGLAQQVAQFVQRMRPRFNNVAFLLPHMCFSAGTIWALSGDEIWMDERSFLGPIDPQVPGKDGRLVPGQALLRLVQKIQEEGAAMIAKGQQPKWSDIQLLQSLDPKEIGNVLAHSQYSIQLASSYLETFKFRDWSKHSDGSPVTPEQKKLRANEIAEKLCDHDLWNVHSNGISRDAAWNQLKIRIDHPETVPALHRALRRLWALLYWGFDNGFVSKIFLSQQYSLFRVPKGTTP